MQSTFLNQNGCNRTTSFIQLCLDDQDLLRITVRICFQFQQPLLSEGSFQEALSIPSSCMCRYRYTDRASAPVFRNQSLLSKSSCFTRSIFALGLSILLIATMISIPAAFAWLIASTVCGMTPSSAATTRIAISVAFAPRIRIAVNAS